MPHIARPKASQDSFLANAAKILDTAVQTGSPGEDWTFLFTQEGQLQMIAGSDWPLESLAATRGAATGYRLHSARADQPARVEGLQGGRRCRLEADDRSREILRALAAPPLYLLR
jgi:hypothetical protein